MESLRDVKRVMEREIEKGSCPLQFEYLEFGEKPFQFIESEEKLNEVLSYLLRLGEYRGYTEHLVGNNVYMDLDMLCRKIQFKRTHSPVERSEIQWTSRARLCRPNRSARPPTREKRLAYGAQCSWTERVHQMEEVLYKKGVLHESAEE